jgi:c-di-GMP-binding flagellar brake protein YcgR
MSNQPSAQDRRRAPRREVDVEAILNCEGFEPVLLRTRDLSSGGVFLRRGDGRLPPLGTEVFVEIAPLEGQDEPMVMQARVVRVTADGIALAFVV